MAGKSAQIDLATSTQGKHHESTLVRVAGSGFLNCSKARLEKQGLVEESSKRVVFWHYYHTEK